MTFDPNKAALHDGVFGLPHGADDARVHLIPVPFEATTSYGGGTAGGPAAISRPAAKSTCTTSTSAIRGRSAST
jgi:arginase family enzyme